MKKNAFFIIFFFFQHFIFAQKDQYYDFIKTWNFIKYYHPDIASGTIDADSLFLATVKNINSKDDFNSVISKLSNNLNKNFINPAPAKTQTDILSQNQNFDWFQKNGKISPENKAFLNHIYNNRYDFSLLKSEKRVNDEKQYSFPKNENLSLDYRLLTLAKIQGSIDYLFPHKYLMNKDFEKFFKSTVEKNINITSRKDFEVTLANLVSKMEDSHALNFYRQLNYKKDIFNSSYFAPFDFQIVDDYILITHLIFPEICKKAQINIGDKITSINGKSISQMIKKKKELLSVSNYKNLLFNLSKYENNLVWTDNSLQKTLEIKSVKDGKSTSKKVDFIDISDKTKYTDLMNYLQEKAQQKQNRQLAHDDIAYFKINHTFKLIDNVEEDKIDTVMNELMEKISQKKAIVFDMRAYPDWGGFIFHYIYKYFSPTENYFAKYYQPNLKNIGTFVYKNYDYFPTIPNKTTHLYKGKVFIIVNSESQSASEWYTMDLQHIFPQAITIGQQTAGADGDTTKVNLPGDYVLEFTGNGIFYPDHSQTQQIGIKINEVIQYKDQDIIENHDLEFERILSLVK